MNLNIVVSSNKEARAEKLEDKEKDFEKVGRKKNVLVDRERNLSIVTVMYNFKFF